MATVYYTEYYGWYCDNNGNEVRGYLKRRYEVDPNSPIQLEPEVKPLIFTGHDDEPTTIEYIQGDVTTKLNPINGSVCGMGIMIVGDMEFSDLYTADEKEWLLQIEGATTWSGFVIPDDFTEPFKAKPYPARLSATDALGTLEDIPFAMDDGTLYRGFLSDLGVLRICLEKTGLSLPYTIGVNTSIIGNRGATDPTKCLLAQMHIDVARFIDEDGVPFSCKEVLRSILERYSARLHQVNGRWQVINALELAYGSVTGWLFDANLNPNGTTEVVNQVTAGGLNRQVHPVGDISLNKAYLNSTAYYQYGYPSNKLNNGDMNIWTNKPNGLPDNWATFGNVTAIGKVRQVNGVDTEDYFIEMSGQGDGHIFNTDPTLVLANQKAVVTFDVYSPEAQTIEGDGDEIIVLNVLVQDENGNWYGTNGWQVAFTWYRITYRLRDIINQIRVSFEVLPRAVNYNLIIGVRQYETEGGGRNIITQVNNAEIQQKADNELTKIAIGDYFRQTSLSKQSFKPDPILLLHSMEGIQDRTSRLSIGFPTVAVNIPIQWSRKNMPGEGKELLQIVANTQLRLHSRPYRIFQADFHGVANITPNTILTTDLLPGQYMFLSGTFDLKTNIHSLRFAEILKDDIPYIEEQRQDYGTENDKNKIDVANPVGVNNVGTVQFNPANFATPAEIPREATELEARAATSLGVFMSPYRTEDWWDAKRSQDVNIVGDWTFDGQPFASSASNVETQGGVVTDKYVSPSTLANWWSWLKTTAQTITGVWNFSTRPTFNGVGLITAADIPKGSDAVLSKSANYTIAMSDFGSNGSATIYVDTTASGVAITLPTATQLNGYTVNVIKVSPDTNSVTVNGTINGVVNDVLANQYDAGTYKSNGTGIFIF